MNGSPPPRPRSPSSPDRKNQRGTVPIFVRRKWDLSPSDVPIPNPSNIYFAARAEAPLRATFSLSRSSSATRACRSAASVNHQITCWAISAERSWHVKYSGKTSRPWSSPANRFTSVMYFTLRKTPWTKYANRLTQ